MSLVTTPEPLLICGDFNFHLDAPEDRPAQRFSDLLDIFNLVQHVKSETHRNGHTLDLIITRSFEASLVSNVHITDPVISDHFAVHCELAIKKSYFPRKEISYRKVNQVDRENFREAIRNSPLMNFEQINNTEELSNLYENTLSLLLEQHAPLKRRIITLRPAAPWYTEEITSQKAERRRLERKWRKTRTTAARQMYVDQCNRDNCLIYESKMKFYSSVIEENSSNQFELFRAVEKMLNLKAPLKLPSHDCVTDLAYRFADFFTEKVQAIRNGFVTSVNTTDHQETTALIDPDCKLHSFTATTADELTTLLAKTWGKSCMLDPLPGKLRKDCSDTLLPVIVRTVNLSFEEAVVPAKFKQGVLTDSKALSEL